jgi:hypothetical protein
MREQKALLTVAVLIANLSRGCANPEPDATDAFAYLWQSIYGQESWNANPWFGSFRLSALKVVQHEQSLSR